MTQAPPVPNATATGDLAVNIIASFRRHLRAENAWFFDRRVDEPELTASPTARMRPPRLLEQRTEVLPEADLRRLLATCEKDMTFTDRRDCALLRPGLRHLSAHHARRARSLPRTRTADPADR
jgi:hypothetical protein